MILIGQALIVFVVFSLYPLFSMLFFGEGGNSYLYSSGNVVLWIIMPISGPTIFNLSRINRGVTDKLKEKIRAYTVIELILLVLYAVFLFWWSINARFKI